MKIEGVAFILKNDLNTYYIHNVFFFQFPILSVSTYNLRLVQGQAKKTQFWYALVYTEKYVYICVHLPQQSVDTKCTVYTDCIRFVRGLYRDYLSRGFNQSFHNCGRHYGFLLIYFLLLKNYISEIILTTSKIKR